MSNLRDVLLATTGVAVVLTAAAVIVPIKLGYIAFRYLNEKVSG